MSDDKLRAVAAHDLVKMFEVKMSQGTKPGKGGILPAAKVTREIAKIRGIKRNTDSLHPNRHPEIDSYVELLAFIAHIRKVPGKPTSLQYVLGAYGWLESMSTEIHARGIESGEVVPGLRRCRSWPMLGFLSNNRCQWLLISCSVMVYATAFEP